ncbi:MAG: acyl-CoA dehydrogenase family protein [Dehalococcoidia bacterium]|nr:acyl-CoA dehydrogenase family protein [Dehalococcoidia bacterium]
MRFAFDTEVEAFRAELKQFLAAEMPPDSQRVEHGVIGEEALERQYTFAFQKKLAAKGWLAMAWPKEYGGGGASHMHQLVYNEEMSYAGAPVSNMGIAWVGPSLMVYGTEEQKQKYIPRITNVEDWWCTLYSEPEAGSDLASLKCAAVRDGDEYVLNGQKIWTTGGHQADWGWLAARTDPDAPKHKGITMFVIDMKSPGVSIRPLYDGAERHVVNEVFFEDVRIPAENVVGEVNRGWYHLAVSLDFERSSIQFSGAGRKTVERMVNLLRDNPGLLEAKPAIRTELADRRIELEVSTMMAYQIAAMQARGMVPNKEASISKNFASELQQRLGITQIRLLGMLGQLRNGSKHQLVDAATRYFGDIPITIAGGSSEINRGIIAMRGLGLPRG